MYNSINVCVDTGQDFITDGVCEFGEFVDAAGRVVAVVDDGYHLPQRGIGHVGYIYDELVHADAADYADETVAEFHYGLVREAPPVSVGVSERYDGGGGIACGGKRASVAYGVAGADVLYLDDRRLKFHDGLKRYRGIGHGSGVVAVEGYAAADHVEVGLGHFDGCSAVCRMNDDVASIWQAGVGKEGVECVQLPPGIGEVFFVGGCKMGVDAGESRVGAVVNTFYQFDGTVGVHAASAHSRVDVDVNIEDIVASVQEMRDVFLGLEGRHDTMEAAVGAGEYPVGGAVGYDGLEDEDGLSVDEAEDMKGFVEACHGEEIDVCVFEYVDHFSDAVSVGVGFYDGAELGMRRTKALECGEVAEQSF